MRVSSNDPIQGHIKTSGISSGSQNSYSMHPHRMNCKNLSSFNASHVIYHTNYTSLISEKDFIENSSLGNFVQNLRKFLRTHLNRI